MQRITKAALVAAKLAVLTVLMAFLAACTITSQSELVTDAEATQIFPASSYLFPYKDDGRDAFAANAEEKPIQLALEGNTYVSDDRSTFVRFAPRKDGTYLMSALSDKSYVYGLATFRDNILGLRIILSGTDDEIKSAVAGINGVTADGGAIEVKTREQLDAVIARAVDGTLGMSGIVIYVGDGVTPPPARIIKDGDGWKAE